MSVLESRDDFRQNPYFANKTEYGDFTPFYITVTICTILGVSLFVLNIVLGCCSRYSEYWNDRHTGNTWNLWELYNDLWFMWNYRQSLDNVALDCHASSAASTRLYRIGSYQHSWPGSLYTSATTITSTRRNNWV